jgi:hypothetical protein
MGMIIDIEYSDYFNIKKNSNAYLCVILTDNKSGSITKTEKGEYIIWIHNFRRE